MIEYLPLVLTGVGIIVSILYYTKVLGSQTKTRQAQLFMELYRTIRSPDFRSIYYEILYQWEWDNVEEFNRKYGQEVNLEAHTKVTSVAMYFEGIGVLLKQNLIDINLVFELMYTSTKLFWERIGPIVISRREPEHDVVMFDDFEYLYSKLREYSNSNR